MKHVEELNLIEGKYIRIIVPVSSPEELGRYRKCILHLLSHIEVDTCDPTTRDGVKVLYKFLNCLFETESRLK